MENNNLTEQAVEGSFWGGAATLANRIGAFFLAIILARFLLPESFGLYTLTMSIAFLFMTFADLGIDQILIRYFAASKDKEERIAYFQYLFKIKIVLTVSLSLLLFLISYPLAYFVFKKPSLFFPLILASLFVLSSVFVFFFSSFFYAIKKTRYLAMGQFLFEGLRMLIILSILLFLSSTYYVLYVIGGLIFTNIIVIFFILYWINKLVSFIFKKTKFRINKKELLKFFGYISLTVMAGLLFTYIDTLMLGFFVSFSYIAYYKVACSLVFGIISLFTSLCLVLLPIFTRIESNRLQRAFNKVLRLILVFTIPCAFGILALGSSILSFFYGVSYFEAKFPLSILAILIITWVPTAVMMTLFFSKSKPREIVKINVVSLFLNMILNYILITLLLNFSELWAIMGAAFATLISRLFLFTYTSISLKRKLNLSLNFKSFVKPLIAGLFMFGFIKMVNFFIIKEITLFTSILEIISGGVFYFLFMFLIKGIAKNDLGIFRRIFKK